MRTLTLLPLAFALVQGAAFAGPQTVQTEPSLSEIRVPGVVPTYKPRPGEIDEIKGVYAFDNGASLKVSNERRRIYARLGRRDPVEMIPVSKYRFVSIDQRMTMEFRPMPFSDEMVLTYPADFDVASSEMVTVRLAQNR
jgi:hypothetical protein